MAWQLRGKFFWSGPFSSRPARRFRSDPLQFSPSLRHCLRRRGRSRDVGSFRSAPILALFTTGASHSRWLFIRHGGSFRSAPILTPFATMYPEFEATAFRSAPILTPFATTSPWGFVSSFRFRSAPILTPFATWAAGHHHSAAVSVPIRSNSHALCDRRPGAAERIQFRSAPILMSFATCPFCSVRFAGDRSVPIRSNSHALCDPTSRPRRSWFRSAPILTPFATMVPSRIRTTWFRSAPILTPFATGRGTPERQEFDAVPIRSNSHALCDEVCDPCDPGAFFSSDPLQFSRPLRPGYSTLGDAQALGFRSAPILTPFATAFSPGP